MIRNTKHVFRLFFCFLFLLLALSLTGCDDEELVETRSETMAQVAQNEDAETFTLMIYLCGSDLESEDGAASADITEILYSELGKHVNVLIETGGAKKWKNKEIRADRVQRWKAEPEGLKLIKDLGQKDMADPETLANFMAWGKASYPADRYGVILWNHGGGTAVGFGVDENFDEDDLMDIYELGKAFKKADVHFDLIGFDACLMGTIENAAVLAPYGDYMIASEESEPGTGWYYTNFLTELEKNPAISIEALGKILVDDYIEGEHGDTFGGMTLSVIDLSRIPDAIDALYDFCAETAGMLRSENGYDEISYARSDAKDFGDGDYEQVDIVDYLAQLEKLDSGKLRQKLMDTVVYSRARSGSAHGLAMYYPYEYPDEYGDIAKVLKKAGIGNDDYEQFYNDFVSMMVYGETHGGGTSSPHGSDDDEDDWFSLLFEDWFDSDVIEEYMPECSYIDSEELVLTKKGDNFVLHLSEEDWDRITTIEQQVFIDDGEGYLELGADNAYEFDDDGDLVVGFDYTWLALDGHLVPFYAEEEGSYDDGGEEWYSYGYVPAVLNDEKDIEIMIMWDSEHEDPYVSGYTYPCSVETGASSRGMHHLNKGDKLMFYFDYYDYDDNYDDSYALEKKPLVVGKKGIRVTYEDLDEDYDTMVYFHLKDIYNNDYWTESVVYE